MSFLPVLTVSAQLDKARRAYHKVSRREQAARQREEHAQGNPDVAIDKQKKIQEEREVAQQEAEKVKRGERFRFAAFWSGCGHALLFISTYMFAGPCALPEGPGGGEPLRPSLHGGDGVHFWPITGWGAQADRLPQTGLPLHPQTSGHYHQWEVKHSTLYLSTYWSNGSSQRYSR